jgi:hypothetical protein
MKLKFNSRHRTTLPALPFDIIALIIDIVGENKDTVLLKELALVSHSFHQICSKHLFATVELKESNYYDAESPKKSFIELFESRPYVAKYIRKITYKVYRSLSPDDNDRQLSLIFIKFLSTFSRLNCLTISTANMDWNTLDSSLTSAFIHLMHLPTINYINLSNIEKNFPLSSLTPCVNLHRLDIFHLKGLKDLNPREKGSPEVAVETIPKIREFHTSESSQLTKKLLHAKRQDGRPVLNFTDLRRISMSLAGLNDERNMRYLLENAKLLEKLHLSVVHGRSLVGVLSSSARTLKALDLSVCLYDNLKKNSVFLGGICEELEALAGHNVLEALSFEVEVLNYVTERFLGSTIRKVEKVLVKPGWSMLRQVSFKVSIALKHPPKNFKALQSLPDKYLRYLSKLESVAFDYSVYVGSAI